MATDDRKTGRLCRLPSLWPTRSESSTHSQRLASVAVSSVPRGGRLSPCPLTKIIGSASEV